MWMKDENGNYFMENDIQNQGYITLEGRSPDTFWSKDRSGNWILIHEDIDN
jgi:hypothetical protein